MDRRKILQRATEFIQKYYRETNSYAEEELIERLAAVEAQIIKLGTYVHTKEELEFGAKVAWRNSNRCIGRLFWDSLTVFDNRHLTDPLDIMKATVAYVKWAENDGKIRPAICVFAPLNPSNGESIRFWNSKLVRYAGYKDHDKDNVTGDPDEVEFTHACQRLGWKGAGGKYDVLPVVIDSPGYETQWFNWCDWHKPLEVPIIHPEYKWFEELELKWYGLPIISDMTLEIGGIEYTAAPFNGWFMGTEIGTRNLADEHRYNMLPEIAERLNLNKRNRSALWRDRALTELNTAVLYSFKARGVTMVDHHSAATQFERFERREKEAGRTVCADWAWLVPPTVGSTTSLFHKQWSNDVQSPNYYYADKPYEDHSGKDKHDSAVCPFHIQTRK